MITEPLKKEIFKIVIEEFISKKEKEVSKLRNKLENEYKHKILNTINEKTIPESQHRKIIQDLINGYESGIYTFPYKKRYSGFIIGTSFLNKTEILEIIKNTFEKHSVNLLNKDIKFCIGEYESIKKNYSRYAHSVVNGDFDFLIYGPHPHSLRGKNDMLSWESYLDKTNTFVYGNHNEPIIQKLLMDALEIFLKNKD